MGAAQTITQRIARPAADVPKVEWTLTDKGMGFIERAGLAGLHMSLVAAATWAREGDRRAQGISKILHWKSDDQGLKLFWDDQLRDCDVLTPVIEWAWQVRKRVYYLPGLYSLFNITKQRDFKEHVALRIATHSGLLATFLQATGQLKPKVGELDPLLVTLDPDNPKETVEIRYRPIKTGETVRQIAPDLLATIFPISSNDSSRLIELRGKSWLHPGAAKRFRDAERDWFGQARLAFLLLFAPIACLYVKLPRTTAKKKLRNNWAFVVPDITSLVEITKGFARLQQEIQTRIDRVDVSGLGEAGLKFASAYSTRPVENQRRSIIANSPTVHVVAMGVTDYYSSSPMITTNIRKAVFHFTPSATSIERYGKLLKHLSNTFEKLNKPESTLKTKRATHWIKTPSARGRIADNLVNNDPWYKDLLVSPHFQRAELENARKRRSDNISIERLWFSRLQYERRALMALIQDDIMWDTADEQELAKVFQDTYRRLLDKEEQALKRGGTRKLFDRWEDKVDELRRGLMHCKTLTLTRQFLTELLAKAGGTKSLTERRNDVWTLLNDRRGWEKLRDLALLALVTFTDGRLGKLKQPHAENKGDNDE